MSIRKVYKTLNVRKAESQTTIEGLHVGDVGSTQLVISLMDGTRAIDLTQYDNVTAMIHGKKPDGYEIHNECDVTTDPGKIIYTLTAQDTAVSGTVYYQLDVQINSEERSFSPCFRTQVSERVYEPVFELLTEQEPPTGWAQHYAEYYKKVDDVYVKNNDPTYAADTFYELVDPPIESASEFQAFWSAYNNTLGVFSEVVEARREYSSLGERLENTAAPTDEQVDEAFSDYIDEHPDLFVYATPEQYGAVGDGVTDDTAAINRCIEENQFIIFSKTYAIDPRAYARAGSGETIKYGISVPSNRILKFLKHSKVICKDELSEELSYWSRGFDLFEVENVVIDGLTLICDRSIENETISGTPVAKGHGVRVSGSKNVTIKNCDISNAYGDGLSVWISGVESSQDPAQRKLCENILIENCTIHENRRNGMTLGGSKNITVSNCKFLNNGNKVVYEGGVVRWGLPPRAGVDIEPNYDHVPVENVAFNNCIFDGNASYDADAVISGSNAPKGYNDKVEFDDAIMENPTAENIENIRTYRKNLSLNSCAIGSAKLRASDVTVEGGKYGFLFIGTAPSKANVFGATIFKVSSGGEQGAANFCGCDFIGNGSDQIFIVNGNDPNSWKGMTLYSCRLIDTKVGMAKTGHLVLNDCFIYQKAGAFSSHGHIHANNTEFHFEDHSNDSIALMTVTSLELKSCDFHYNPENSNLRFFSQAGSYSDHYTYYTWFNNRFHNALPNNINLNVIGNSLVKNFFNFASAKITNSVTGQTIVKIGNIYSDVKEFQSLINSSHKLSSDLIDDTGATNKFVTATEKSTWDGKANSATTLAGYGITDAYTKTQVDSKVSSVYKYKGSVSTYQNLPSTDLTVGDVYNVESDGSNYAWTGSAWDKLGGNVDLSGSQIVSGVVNANGTITFTDSDGNTFTTTGSSVIGPQGDDYILTAQDKSDIADIVLSELPTTQGVLYGNTSN